MPSVRVRRKQNEKASASDEARPEICKGEEPPKAALDLETAR